MAQTSEINYICESCDKPEPEEYLIAIMIVPDIVMLVCGKCSELLPDIDDEFGWFLD